MAARTEITILRNIILWLSISRNIFSFAFFPRSIRFSVFAVMLLFKSPGLPFASCESTHSMCDDERASYIMNFLHLALRKHIKKGQRKVGGRWRQIPLNTIYFRIATQPEPAEMPFHFCSKNETTHTIWLMDGETPLHGGRLFVRAIYLILIEVRS